MTYSPDNYPGKAVGLPWEESLLVSDKTLKLDQNNLDALVSTSNNLLLLWCFGFYSRERALPRARVAAEKAVVNHPDSGEAHMVLAILNFSDWRYSEAEAGYKKALQLAPQHALLHHYYALYQVAAVGDYEKAYRYSHLSVELDPSPGLLIGLASMMYFAQDFEDMIKLLVPLIKEDPSYGAAYDWLGMAYVQLERFDESIDTYRKAVKFSDNTMEVVSGLGHAYGMADRHDEAREVLTKMHEAATQTYVPQVQIAFVHAGLGDYEGALNQLDLAYQAKAWELSFMRTEPWLECVADDPRFKKIVGNIGFPGQL
jgi:tetratricopeptide (TPR) repeat protein